MLLSGDAIHFEEQLTRGNEPGFNTDRASNLASMDRLSDMATNLQAILAVQHDINDIGKLPTFPTPAN